MRFHNMVFFQIDTWFCLLFESDKRERESERARERESARARERDQTDRPGTCCTLWGLGLEWLLSNDKKSCQKSRSRELGKGLKATCSEQGGS